MTRDRARWAAWPVLLHSVRTATAAVVSLLIARMFGLRESYWAPITTIVITQSSLGAALAVSRSRFIGTALGAAVGALLTSRFESSMPVFGAAIFLLGLITAVVHADRAAYRFGGIALAIVLLVPRSGPGWQVAFHRFAEVFIGIAVALILAWVWPESDGPPLATPASDSGVPVRSRIGLKQHFK